jgi:hypothetical protein
MLRQGAQRLDSSDDARQSRDGLEVAWNDGVGIQFGSAIAKWLARSTHAYVQMNFPSEAGGEEDE